MDKNEKWKTNFLKENNRVPTLEEFTNAKNSGEIDKNIKYSNPKSSKKRKSHKFLIITIFGLLVGVGAGFGIYSYLLNQSINGMTGEYYAINSKNPAIAKTISFTIKGKTLKATDQNGKAQQYQVDTKGKIVKVTHIEGLPQQQIIPVKYSFNKGDLKISGAEFTKKNSPTYKKFTNNKSVQTISQTTSTNFVKIISEDSEVGKIEVEVATSAVKKTELILKEAQDKVNQENKVAMEKAEKQPMDLIAISKGDYSSIVGEWRQVDSYINRHDGKGVQPNALLTSTLSVNTNQIVWDNQTTLSKKDISGTGSSGVTSFNFSKGTLIASKDGGAIAYDFSFYPAGIIDDLGYSKYISQNRIFVRTSNNGYGAFFVQSNKNNSINKVTISSATQDTIKKSLKLAQNAVNSIKVSDKLKQKSELQVRLDKISESLSNMNGIDLEQIMINNYSSLVGTWENPSNGSSIVVTNQLQQSNGISGVIINIKDKNEKNFYQEVITSGKIMNGYMQGSEGTFPKSGDIGSFAPIAIIPKNVVAGLGGVPDDSDSTQDRLILGGGQGGFKKEAYYKK